MTTVNGIRVSESTLRNENLYRFGEPSVALHVEPDKKPKYQGKKPAEKAEDENPEQRH